MQKQRAFIPARSSSISHLHQLSGKMPEKESEFQKYKGFIGDLGAVGGVRGVALADWLGLGVVGGVRGRGSGRLAGSKGGWWASC